MNEFGDRIEAVLAPAAEVRHSEKYSKNADSKIKKSRNKNLRFGTFLSGHYAPGEDSFTKMIFLMNL